MENQNEVNFRTNNESSNQTNPAVSEVKLERRLPESVAKYESSHYQNDFDEIKAESQMNMILNDNQNLAYININEQSDSKTLIVERSIEVSKSQVIDNCQDIKNQESI